MLILSKDGWAQMPSSGYREEVLNAHLFVNLNQVRELIYRWLETSNETRPHDALGRVPQSVFRRQLEEAEAA